jgi:hypothetical protein
MAGHDRGCNYVTTLAVLFSIMLYRLGQMCITIAFINVNPDECFFMVAKTILDYLL